MTFKECICQRCVEGAKMLLTIAIVCDILTYLKINKLGTIYPINMYIYLFELSILFFAVFDYYRIGRKIQYLFGDKE